MTALCRVLPSLAAGLVWFCGSAPALAQGGAHPEPPASRPTPTAGARPSDLPWRLHQALHTPKWLRFGLEHRLRFEQLANDFRASSTGDAIGLVLRTLLSAELQLDPVILGAELQDSRAYAFAGTPLNTGIVNPLELLQAYAGLRLANLLRHGDQLLLRAGRITMDLGSRRLLARNRFRNTINSFNGLELQWTSPGRHSVRLFGVMPVVRLPSDPAALAENEIEIDRESTDAIFWGAFYGSPTQAVDSQLEAYVLGLCERDGTDTPSSDRCLATAGFRILRPPARGRFDLQLEGILQVGRSRATTAPTDTWDLDHFAFSIHVSAGYRFALPWAPRFALHYDYASGDASPDDSANDRFDPLFGARAFDFGPTGLYGAFARSNINSPAARIEIAPAADVDALIGYRLAWLASARDAWTTARLRDASGASGSFIGHQLEGRVRWQALPGNLWFELGAAYLIRGGFARQARSARPLPAAFVYTQLTGTI